MANTTLPQKREGDDKVMSPKEAKAQKKMEAIAKAREWAKKRKGGEDDDVGGGDTPKKARAEAEDVITNLPDIPAKKSSKKSSGGSVASDTESIGSRTRSRRRSMGVAAPPAEAKKPAAVSSPKKSPQKSSSPRKTPAKSKKKAPVQEQVAEEQQAAPEE